MGIKILRIAAAVVLTKQHNLQQGVAHGEEAVMKQSHKEEAIHAM